MIIPGPARLLVALALASLSVSVSAGHGSGALDRIVSLPWQYARQGRIELVNESTLGVDRHDALLSAPAAGRYLQLVSAGAHRAPLALVVRVGGRQKLAQVTYYEHRIGYIDIKDFHRAIGAASIRPKERHRQSKPGARQVEFSAWLQTPLIDHTGTIVSWAELWRIGPDRTLAQVKVLRLNRYGLTEIHWAGPPESFSDAAQIAAELIASYQLAPHAHHARFDPATDRRFSHSTAWVMGAGAPGPGKTQGSSGGRLVCSLLMVLGGLFLMRTGKSRSGARPGRPCRARGLSKALTGSV